MAKKEPQDALEAISRIRSLLADWLRTSIESRVPVAEILKLAEVVERHLRRSGPKGGRKYGAEKRYKIEQTAQGEVLTEHRAGGAAQPFRCPKPVYDAVAVALAKVKQPVDFEQMMELTRQKRAVPAGSFHLRVVTRFWLSREQPLLERVRSRYRPVSPSSFVADAEEAWTNLKKSG